MRWGYIIFIFIVIKIRSAVVGRTGWRSCVVTSRTEFRVVVAVFCVGRVSRLFFGNLFIISSVLFI